MYVVLVAHNHAYFVGLGSPTAKGPDQMTQQSHFPNAEGDKNSPKLFVLRNIQRFRYTVPHQPFKIVLSAHKAQYLVQSLDIGESDERAINRRVTSLSCS